MMQAPLLRMFFVYICCGLRIRKREGFAKVKTFLLWQDWYFWWLVWYSEIYRCWSRYRDSTGTCCILGLVNICIFKVGLVSKHARRKVGLACCVAAANHSSIFRLTTKLMQGPRERCLFLFFRNFVLCTGACKHFSCDCSLIQCSLTNIISQKEKKQ